MTLAFVVFVVVVVVGSFVLAHDVDCLNVLPTDVEALVDEALGMFGVFVGSGCLEPILTYSGLKNCPNVWLFCKD